VRNYTRQVISKVTDDVVTIRVRRGKVKLPQRPIIAVTSVVDANANPILYSWDGIESVNVASNLDSWSFEPWVDGIRTAVVTYTHGYDPIPDDIVGVVCSIVMRALGREPVDAGITSESIQGYSYSIGVVGAAGAFGMLNSEMAILDAYCRTAGPISTMPAWISP
jgi:hypothetical protein